MGLALLGDRAWWLPRRLDRALPHLDVEGENFHVPGASEVTGKGLGHSEPITR
ncbi:hypothetical protein [Streptomyces sp. NPDC001536]|uniref:hypothetical protein n=1 Tax=Streptomyces sp. NPDC001536 TaxID=3364583 RepID=UPI0036CCECDB